MFVVDSSLEHDHLEIVWTLYCGKLLLTRRHSVRLLTSSVPIMPAFWPIELQ